MRNGDWLVEACDRGGVWFAGEAFGDHMFLVLRKADEDEDGVGMGADDCCVWGRGSASVQVGFGDAGFLVRIFFAGLGLNIGREQLFREFGSHPGSQMEYLDGVGRRKGLFPGLLGGESLEFLLLDFVLVWREDLSPVCGGKV